MAGTVISSAAERNKEPILEVLQYLLEESFDVLEIGSGTGQHATYFAARMPHLVWQPSDCKEYLPDLSTRIRRHGLKNILPPVELDVRNHPWPVSSVDVVFSANTLHIMSWPAVEHFFAGVGEVLEPCGLLCVYGPFMYDGAHTSDSNARFDEYLRARDPGSGIRAFEDLDALARRQQLELDTDYQMPANNRMLVWRRVAACRS